MHIEPGILSQVKIALANVTATGVLGYYVKNFVSRPADLIRAGLAAVFFSLFMQSFHMPVGPSELHFVGAMAIYLTLGFIPTVFGFAAGLVLQGALFEPQDLVHLAINSLSLIVPLIAVHYTVGKKFVAAMNGKVLNWGEILRLDAMYYGGVVTMVAFWLAVSEVSTPFAAWLTFATSYLAVVLIEPFVTYGSVRLLKRYENTKLVDMAFAVKSLNILD